MEQESNSNLNLGRTIEELKSVKLQLVAKQDTLQDDRIGMYRAGEDRLKKLMALKS